MNWFGQQTAFAFAELGALTGRSPGHALAQSAANEIEQPFTDQIRMRITNAHYSPIDLLAELIAPRRIKESETTEYFSGERSSHDWLVTAVAERIDVVLESFKRYGTEVAETQFIRDKGIDVRLSFDDSNKQNYRVGIQVKSNQEADRDAIRPRVGETMIGTLKRQAFEAERHGMVDEWWIFSGFDAAKHKTLISGINTELDGGVSGRMRIRHVKPRETMAFLSLDDEEIDAICTLLLCDEDPVLKAARREVYELGPMEQDIVWEFFGNAIEGDREYSLHDLDAITFSNEPDLSEIQEAVESLSGFIDYDLDRDSYKVEPSFFPGLCALYFDARVRHGYTPSAANKFLKLMTRKLDES